MIKTRIRFASYGRYAGSDIEASIKVELPEDTVFLQYEWTQVSTRGFLWWRSVRTRTWTRDFVRVRCFWEDAERGHSAYTEWVGDVRLCDLLDQSQRQVESGMLPLCNVLDTTA